MRRLVIIGLLCLGLAPAWAQTGMEWVEQAQQAEAAGQLEPAVRAWEKAAEILSDPAAKATALFFLGRGQMQLGRHEESLHSLRSSLALFDQLDRDDGRAMVESQLGYLFIELRRDAEAEASLTNAHEAAERFGDERRQREVLKALAEFCDTRHRWPEAAHYYRLLIELERAAGNPLAVAEAQITLGAIAQLQSDYTSAEALYREALAAFEQADQADRIQPLVDRLGRMHLQSEQFDQASQEFARVIELARARGDRQKEAATLANLGYAEQRAHHRDQAAEAYRASLDLFTQLGDDDNRRLIGRQLIKVLNAPEQARAVDELYPRPDQLQADQRLEAAGLCLELGLVEKAQTFLVAPPDEGRAAFLNRAGMLWSKYSRYDLARPLFEQALELAQASKNRALEASTHNNLGEMEHSLGALDRSEMNYRLAYGIFEELGDRSSLAYLCNNLGQIYFDQGRYRQALQILGRAESLALDPAVFGKPVPLVGTVLNAMGLTHVFLGRPLDAENYYQRALAVRKALNDRRGEVVTLTNLGALHSESNKPELAIATSLKALSLAQELKDPNLTANLYNNLGSQYQKSGDLASAEQAYSQALELFREIGARGSQGIALDNIGSLLLEQDKLAESSQHHRQAIALLQESGQRLPLCSAYVHLGHSLLRSEKNEEADLAFQEASELLEDLALGLTPQDRASFLQRAKDLHGWRMQLMLSLNQQEAAFTISEQARAQELLAMLAGRETSLEGVPSVLVERERTLRETIRALVAAPFSPHNRTELNRYKELYRVALQEIARYRPVAASARSADAAAPRDLRAQLGPDQAMICFYLFERSTLAAVLTSQDFQFYRLPMTPKSLKKSVAQVRRLLGEPGTAPAAEQVLRELGEGLLGPLQQAIQGKSHLIIVPSGDLHYLPFASLQLGGRSLVEDYQLEIAGSATAWLLLHSRPTQPGPVAGFALGNYDIDWTQSAANPDAELGLVRGQNFAALPGTLAELEELERLFPDGRAFRGQELTVRKLEQEAESAGVLHVATHGVLDRRYPLFSGLVAADGMLTVGDIFEWKRAPSLVVLSACQTGLGDVAEGDDIVGLSRAFQYAGARSLVASLWSVDDRSTADWMGFFYRELRAGATTAQAHRVATLKTRERYPNPYFWAPFILYGDGTTRLVE